MILVGIEPVIVRAGPLTLRWSTLVVLVALAAGGWLTLGNARRRGISGPTVLGLAAWALPAGLLGAHALAVAGHWEQALTRPAVALEPNTWSLEPWGAYLVGGLVARRLARAEGVPFGAVADAAAPGLALGEALVQVGSFLDGRGQGVPSSLPWATQYLSPDALSPDFGIARHPLQLYRCVADLAILGALLGARSAEWPPGRRSLLALQGYAVARLALGFLDLEPAFLVGLRLGQWVAACALVISAFAIIRAASRRRSARAGAPPDRCSAHSSGSESAA